MTSPAAAPGSPRPAARLRDRLAGGVGVIVSLTALLWFIEAVDSVVLDDRLQGGGIQPRELSGLDGVLWAPFLHVGFGHVLSNTVPFVLLGLLVMTHGRARWAQVCIGVALIGGLATWVFARSGNHIGASGVVFGLLGYLVGAAFAARSPRAIWTGIVAIFLYGGLLWGVLPSPGISWEGHLFGALAGVLMALLLGKPVVGRRRTGGPTMARRMGRRFGS